MGKADVTIVVVAREQFSVALRSLDSILEWTDDPYEMVYVDGNSSPDVRAGIELRARERGFQLLRSERFLSPNRARNLALRHVRTPYVCFVDNDLIVTRGWLAQLRECAEETGASIVGPLYLEGEPEDQIIHMAGGTYEFGGEAPRRTFATDHLLQGTCVSDLVDPLRRGPCDFVEFHCMLVQRSLFDRVGEMDEGLRNTREHLDLCIAAREAGEKVWFAPESVVIYKAPPPLERSDRRFFLLRWSEAWTRQSLAHFVRKHGVDPAYTKRSSIARARRGLVYRPWVERVQACFGRRVAKAVATGLAMVESSYNHLFVRPPTSGEVESVR